MYIDDLLVITRGTLVEDHLDKLREVLKRLCKAGLKVNVIKSHFCTHEIEYLGYNTNPTRYTHVSSFGRASF